MWVISDYDYFDDTEQFGTGQTHDLYSDGAGGQAVLGPDGLPMRKGTPKNPIGFVLKKDIKE